MKKLLMLLLLSSAIFAESDLSKELQVKFEVVCVEIGGVVEGEDCNLDEALGDLTPLHIYIASMS